MFLEVFASTADGQVESLNGTYSVARAGSSLFANSSLSYCSIGQNPFYAITEAYISFDLSGEDLIGFVITDVTLALAGKLAPTTDYTVEARTFDSGATLTTADWVAGADLANYTLLATWDTTNYVLDEYGSFTENGTNLRNAVETAVAGSGMVHIFLHSDRMRTNNAPTTSDYFRFGSGDTADFKPRLSITYQAANEPFSSDVVDGHRHFFF